MASPDRSAEARDLARELARAGRFRRLMHYLALTWLADAAAKSGADFLAAPLSAAWTNGDFVDNGHFNAAGAQKFAASIAEDVRRLCR